MRTLFTISNNYAHISKKSILVYNMNSSHLSGLIGYYDVKQTNLLIIT